MWPSSVWVVHESHTKQVTFVETSRVKRQWWRFFILNRATSWWALSGKWAAQERARKPGDGAKYVEREKQWSWVLGRVRGPRDAQSTVGSLCFIQPKNNSNSHNSADNRKELPECLRCARHTTSSLPYRYISEMAKWNTGKLPLSHLLCEKQSYFKYDTSDIPLKFQISNKYPYDKS